LTSIPRGLPGGIRELDLSFNDIRVIHGKDLTFAEQTLQSLKMSSSKVFHIAAGALDRLPQLQRLDLSFNLFQTFPLAGEGNLCVRSRLQHFDFSNNNHLVCDCNSLVLSQWMNQRPSVFDDTLLPFTQCWNRISVAIAVQPSTQWNIANLTNVEELSHHCPQEKYLISGRRSRCRLL
jgi:Leucine-rich repeat (LRR) protein